MIALALLSAGCGQSTRPRYQIQVGADSTRWLAVCRSPVDGSVLYVSDSPYALTWAPNRAMNLWARGQLLVTQPFIPEPQVANYFAAFRGTLPFAWATGDTIRGVEVASSPDTTPVVSGAFWAVVDADTMHGETFVELSTFAGLKRDTVSFRLERASNPSVN